MSHLGTVAFVGECDSRIDREPPSPRVEVVASLPTGLGAGSRRALVVVAALLAILASPTDAAAAPSRGKSRVHAPRRATAQPAPSAPPRAAPRRLRDIAIEGELPVPQVLFITARDQRRLVEFDHRRYLPTSRELAERMAAPRRVAVGPAERP